MNDCPTRRTGGRFTVVSCGDYGDTILLDRRYLRYAEAQGMYSSDAEELNHNIRRALRNYEWEPLDESIFHEGDWTAIQESLARYRRPKPKE